MQKIIRLKQQNHGAFSSPRTAVTELHACAKYGEESSDARMKALGKRRPYRLQNAHLHTETKGIRKRSVALSLLRNESRTEDFKLNKDELPFRPMSEAQSWQWLLNRGERLQRKRSIAERIRHYSEDIVGLTLAFSIFASWALTLLLLFSQPEKAVPSIIGNFATPSTLLNEIVSVIVLMTVRMWLTTGLFVTVHDAIHGVVSPNNLKLNHTIGAFFAFCYASFSYKLLYRDHWRHHRSPTAVSDPDWYAGGFWKWISGFLGHYSTPSQLFWESFQFWGMCALGYRLFKISFAVMVLRVSIIWAIPALLSGVQLFYFGTYLPHCNNPGGQFHARSNDWHYLLSLLSCFHFGACHEEHHAYPWVPWWNLPHARAQAKQNQKRRQVKESS